MVTVLTLFTMTSNFFWMLAEGVFLAVVLVITFLQNTGRILIICHIIGWGVLPNIQVLILTFNKNRFEFK